MSKNSAKTVKMAHRILLIASIMALAASASAQTTITLDIQQSFGPQAWLYRYVGDSFKLIDSCSVGYNGLYRFVLPADAPHGQYQLQIGRANTIDLLIHNEPLIAMRTTIFAVHDSLKIVQSDENKVFVKFNRLRDNYKHKHKLLTQLQKLYPTQSPFGQQLAEEQTNAQTEFCEQAQRLANAHSNLLAASFIAIDPETHPIQPQPESADSYWANIDLQHPSLLHTPQWEASLWHFVGQLLRHDQLDKEQQDDLYSTAFAALLNRPMADTVRAAIVHSLCNGFSESDYYKAIETLLAHGGRHAERFAQDPELRLRLKQERQLTIGAKAHDFRYLTTEDRLLRLSNSPGRYRLLLFWSIWCPHCVELLPDLRQLYNQYQSKGLEIIGISVNVDDPEVTNFVQSNQLPWLNTVFTSKNEDELAKHYNVDGTPKMLLIDDKMRIVSKPVNIQQLRLKLEKIF